MNKFTKLLSSAAICVGTFAGAAMAETKLVISTWLPPKHAINTGMFQGLIDMMEEATGGEVTAELKHGLAPPPAQMDLVMDGAADFAIIFHGYQPGRFTGTKLIELPGYEGNAEAASVAYWRVHEKHLAKLDEHRGVKLVSLNTHGPGQVHSNAKVTEMSQINGMKIRIGGGVAGDVGAALGMKGIRVPAPKVYETLASNAADGVAMPVESRRGFKLTEVAKNVYEMPGGFYRGSFAVIMSQEAFDALPEAAQKALDEKVFGEPASRMMGAVWDASDAAGYEATNGAADNVINVANEADQAAFGKIAADVTAKVLAELEAAGVDAQAAYDMVKSEMAAN
ncbi:TRAP transporter substrate-binding protein [Alisedimentitalea sp. MJ-SS2]|uniref:TRAP transporter substrate-binding protein n=1 Tax=Aliisedimentitalea sp. MJ-SS2 TaxID=3049795 RepID=UPI00290FF2ED|nr:TRAP transporter substrate-binding protein [Alisedimentitalea sp. MJ-SS2]MDU8925824.1 TRAP transporter substrate-binding protein [Alisedimentitalea sp. MJ-SS2]